MSNPPPSSSPASADAANGEITGVVERVVFYNEENLFCIAEVKVDRQREPVTIKGTLPEIQCGETVRVRGKWRHHATYGDQLMVEEYDRQLPSSVYGIRKYLGSGMIPGIGKTYAEKIVDHFGEKTLDVISHQSKRLREVPGIGAKRAADIKEAWDRQQAQREVFLFLQTYGVTNAQCRRLVKKYGNTVQTVLRADPYQVVHEVDGIGFKTADRIARNLGFANDSVVRLRAGLLYALRTAEDEGHTGLRSDDLLAAASEILDADPKRLEPHLDDLLTGGDINDDNPAGLLQLPAHTRHETTIAERLGLLLRTPSGLPPIKQTIAVDWAEERAGFTFAPEQRDALLMALHSRVSILTGGPGTGKTTILRALTEILRAKKVRVYCAAPTGRAAQRMRASTGLPAATIHRMLAFDPAAGGFQRNENSPLKVDFLVVDEASMLDTRLAAALFRALPAPCHLLLVGDVDQLPSVGPGRILHDLIASERFPVTRLQRIFRQGRTSGIATTAHGILAGDAKPPAPLQDLPEIEGVGELFFLHAPDPEQCVARITDLVAHELPARLDIDPVRDIQVIAPMHRGTAGISALNTALRAALLGETPTAAGFVPGDKVMQMRNNYDLGVYNGDQGVVVGIAPNNAGITIRFDHGEVLYAPADLSELALACATSVHKSQGSEYPVVIIPLLKQHYMLLQRNLLYTAITRGKRLVLLVGDPAAYALAVNRRESLTRLTGLVASLQTRIPPRSA